MHQNVPTAYAPSEKDAMTSCCLDRKEVGCAMRRHTMTGPASTCNGCLFLALG